MRLTNFFMPTMKEIPAEAQIASHRLMLRAGMIRQSSSGIYSWLPLGFRVMKKIEAIVREEQNASGAHEILMPTIQPADIWRESGRYDEYGKEMLRISDRHDRDMLYGPTNEELVTDIFRNNIRSYRDLPLNLYHIQWKFRDEVRPRFGIMRGREFYMKDAYSFDIDAVAGRHSYNKMFVSYLRTFSRLGLTAIPMAADTGPIGGDLSHEFLILAETGESEVYCHKDLTTMEPLGEGVDYNSDLQPLVNRWTSLYAASDEKHDQTRFEANVPREHQVSARGIEVGHVFYFGSKYSAPMGAVVVAQNGDSVPVEMGSYGIGVSRLVGAIIEANHDDRGIVWPESVAPFHVGLINLKSDHENCRKVCDVAYSKLTRGGVEVLYDDTEDRAGAKFAKMDLIGLPWQLIIGPKGLANDKVELRSRAGEVNKDMSLDNALASIGI